MGKIIPFQAMMYRSSNKKNVVSKTLTSKQSLDYPDNGVQLSSSIPTIIGMIFDLNEYLICLVQQKTILHA